MIYSIVLGNVYAVFVYFINNLIGTNYLYVNANSAPAGSAIEKLSIMFGWPGYVFAMDVIAITIMLAIFLISKVITKLTSTKAQ